MLLICSNSSIISCYVASAEIIAIQSHAPNLTLALFGPLLSCIYIYICIYVYKNMRRI